ncbi:hypothetical protein [Lentzea guizhouensis]|nr:hypothetical protein [Lentzea guizhouensis]
MLNVSRRQSRQIELLTPAHHEAGHAVILVDGGISVESVQLFKSERGASRPYWGHVSTGLEVEECSRQQLEVCGVCAFAGAEAEAFYLMLVGFTQAEALDLAYSGAEDDLATLFREVLPRLRLQPEYLRSSAANAVHAQWPRIERIAAVLAVRMQVGPRDLG